MTYCPVTFNATRSRRPDNTGGDLFQLESSCHVLLPEFDEAASIFKKVARVCCAALNVL